MIIEDADDDDLEQLMNEKRNPKNNDSVHESFLISSNNIDSKASKNSKHQDFVIKSMTNNDFDILQQVEAVVEEKKIEPESEDYMDRFFDSQSEINKRRNRRTSPLWTKPEEFQNKFQNVKSAAKPDYLDKHMLDGDFKITTGLTDHKNLRNRKTIQLDSSMINKGFGNDQDEQECEEVIETEVKVELDLEPEFESINEDNLDPAEDVDNYMNEVMQKYKEQILIDKSLILDRDNQSSQVQQLRNLQDSIISSVTEMLQSIDDDDESKNPGNPNAQDTEEILNIKFNQSFSKDFYTSMHQDVLMREMTPKSKRKAQILQKITNDEWDYKDIVKIIDWNERRHREVAQQQLKQNSVISLQNVSTKDIKIRVLTPFQTMNSVSNKMQKERSFSQARATCVALTDRLILVGNSEGQLWMFDRDTEEEYSNFSEKSKDFLGNSVTALDVHPLRPEYVILGYERGQLVLIDIQEPKKSVKVIKDHHKQPIMNLKFCDWQGANMDDKQAWMFISIDQQGKVIINTIHKVLFVLTSSKNVVVDPNKYDGHGLQLFDDVPIFALGNAEQVEIIEARSSKHQQFLKFERPARYFNSKSNDFKDFKARVPSLSWGYGHSPVIKERPHSLLAVAWGPLIQLIVLFDHEGANEQQPFIADGYYIIRNFGMNESPNTKQPRRSTMARLTDSQISGEKKYTSLKSSLVIDEEDSTKEIDNMDFTQQSQEQGQYNQSESFTESNLDIEQIQFFSDSTLLIVTKLQEIRILNVSAFNPNTYDAELEKIKTQTPKKIKSSKKTNIPEDISSLVELEYGLRISSTLQKSEYGALYHQTIRFFKGKIVALTTKNIQQCQHLTWQQSIFEFKKIVEDDLVQVFSRALDIYKGNVKGYAGLPDEINQREIKLKDEIKLLVREIISQVIQKTRQAKNILKKDTKVNNASQNNTIDEFQSSLIEIQQEQEFKDEKAIKYQTLIRIAIEFCVELKDQKFLFYDLFILFKDEKLEDVFIHELEPFIMAGKFQEWELPNEVIQNHVLKYYKDSSKADALEKIIVNLNLAQCPKTIVLEFIHYSEQNCLTTAILYLYTQFFEKKDILFSLFDLYKKAGKKNQGLLIDIQNLKEFTYDSKEKQIVEKSQIYLGYKILWVIRMFLNGLKFPQGNIRTSKWKTYIHDIIELLQSNDILKVLLEIDADSFFQTIAIIFYPSKPCELFDQDRDDEIKDANQIVDDKPQPISNHGRFVKGLDSYCMSVLTKDVIKYQYIFFAANVIAKSYIRGLDNLYYYNIARELFQQYKRYLEYNKKLQIIYDKKNLKITEKLNKYRKYKQAYENLSEMKYVIKTENDFMNLLEKSEPMDNFQIMELSKLAEPTQFNQVKILLMEKREEYLKCLTMFIHEFQINSIWTAEIQSQKVIKWIREKIIILEEKASSSQQDKNFCEQFKREVQQNIGKLLVMNPAETIHLIEEYFNSSHKEMVDYLNREPLLQMLYLDTLLTEKESLIEKTIKSHGLQSSNPKDAKKYIELLKQHLRLCCQYKKEKVLTIVEKMIRNSYYPIEDCLEICQEYHQIEATFILNRKVGKYFECVQEGLQILKSKIEYNKLKIELYMALTQDIDLSFPVINDYMLQTVQFDTQFKLIMKICKKNYKEVEREKEELIWYIVIDALLELKADPILVNKFYCKSFIRDRLQVFSEQLIRAVPFTSFLNHQLKINKKLRFKEFGQTIQTQLNNQISENTVLVNANNAIYKVNSELFSEFQSSRRRGILFRQRLCTMCKRYMDSFLYGENSPDIEDQQYLLAQRNEEEQEDDNSDTYNQPIKVFACKHTFHLGCLERHFRRRKKNESDTAYQRRIEKLRCPTCNLKSYEIESGPRAQRRTPRSTPQGTQSGKFNFGRKESYIQQDPKNRKESQLSGASTEDIDKTELWERERQKRIAKEQSDKQRKLEMIQKRMEYYEQQNEIEGLNIKDFKQVELQQINSQ